MGLIRELVGKWMKASEKLRLDRAAKLVEAHGFAVVKIIRRAGSDYILAADGSLHRIGRK